jgi:hypothetical protein
LYGSSDAGQGTRHPLECGWPGSGLSREYSIWGVQSSRSTLSAQRGAIGDLTGQLDALVSENATL